MPTKFLLCYVPCPNEASAKKIANKLVTEKLAACCNIIPGIKSIYEWNGELQEDNEVILIAKTTKEKFKAIENKVLDMHKYDCPCILSVDVENLNSSYASWLLQQCQVPQS